jgi:serine/threonine-protein phosphatase 2A regulatory subunit B'
VSGQKVLTEATYKAAMDMVAINVFRALPAPREGVAGEEVTGQSGGGGEGGDESESFLEPAWVHLQLVYEFFLRFILSNEVKTKSAKKYLDTAFCGKLIELFESEDPRERDYLKVREGGGALGRERQPPAAPHSVSHPPPHSRTPPPSPTPQTILHRIYGKFMTHRSFIRKAISHVFFRFVYETERHSGTGELLEILGSIINGFALPLKPEHVTFLDKALMPLHKPRCVANYLQQLTCA